MLAPTQIRAAAALAASTLVLTSSLARGQDPVSFELPNLQGRVVTLAELSDAKIVVLAFLGTECPLARQYAPRLGRLADAFASRGVAMIGIASNCQDTTSELAAFAKKYRLPFPILKDLGNRVADQLGAERTPEVFVLDDRRVVRYRGRVDDQYGVGTARARPDCEDLSTALEELLAGRPVSRPVTAAVGCLIGRVAEPSVASPVTYRGQIADVLHRNCVECHRAGEIGPFSLATYEDTVGWGEMLAEVVREGRMPPWHADPRYGSFQNERRMSDAERQLLYAWVAHGAPEGVGEVPQPPPAAGGQWRLPGEPDCVIPMSDRPFKVPAEGTVEYQYFVVDPGFTEDKWVRAAQVLPGNREVVHHAVVFVRSPEELDERRPGWLGAYVPGQRPLELGPGRGRRVRAGSKLVFQLHYTPNGSPQEDLSRIGLVYADPESIAEEVVTLVALDRSFEIPPHAGEFAVRFGLNRLPASGTLLGLGPHMHVRGKSFRVIAHERDGTERILLDVPRYDFNWQHVYALAESIELGDIARFECEARFDNSAENPVNPDPAATVRWGDQTWEEMAMAYFDVAIAIESVRRSDTERQGAVAAARRRKAEQFVARFDRNGNGRVERSEVPSSFEAFAFNRFDRNGDGGITADEAERIVESPQ